MRGAFIAVVFIVAVAVLGGMAIDLFSQPNPDIEHTQGDGTYVPAPWRN